MKESYKRILIFHSIISLILILNSFVYSFLGGYSMVIFLCILLVSFRFLCGFEKDRHRYIKDILFEIIIFLLIFFLLFYLFGLIIGFARTSNYFTFDGIVIIILPLILRLILTELLRYQVLVKSEFNKKLIVLSCIVFTFLEISTALHYANFSTPRSAFIFCSLTILPAITKNIVASYLSLKFGYKPMIFYTLVTNLYVYIIPIVPNPNEFITSLIWFLLPIALLVRVVSFVNKEKDKEIDRDYRKRSLAAYILPTLLVIVSVYFTSGYFRFYAIAIASGSMTPNIRKGDVVIIDKKYSDIDIGQVIAFKNGKIIVVHRVINKIKVGNSTYYYTQGDANVSPDGYPIESKDIVGVVNVKLPYIGIPTVWVNEL